MSRSCASDFCASLHTLVYTSGIRFPLVVDDFAPFYIGFFSIKSTPFVLSRLNFIFLGKRRLANGMFASRFLRFVPIRFVPFFVLFSSKDSVEMFQLTRGILCDLQAKLFLSKISLNIIL